MIHMTIWLVLYPVRIEKQINETMNYVCMYVYHAHVSSHLTVQVLWSWYHRLRIWAQLSVIRGLAIASPTVDVGFLKLAVGQFLWKQGLQFEGGFSSAVNSAAVILWLFETILLNVRWSLSATVDFRPLFLLIRVRRHNLRNWRPRYLIMSQFCRTCSS
jgi:hypothetical protein